MKRMKKYAMIPINSKEDADGNLLVRRVLISYMFKTHKRGVACKMAYYRGVKFIFADNYFYEGSATHKYEFSNKGYILKEVKNNPNELMYAFKSGIYKNRKYHGLDKPYKNYPCVIEFKAISEQAAIEKFNNREEHR